MVSAFIQAISATIDAELFFCTIAITGGLCSFSTEFADDIEGMLHELNTALIAPRSEQLINSVRYEIKENIADIIRFHGIVIELSVNFLN